MKKDARWVDATVESVEKLTPRIVGLRLRAALARPDAGQHVDVRLTAPDGYQARRSYSIASPPSAELIELAIERLDDGEVSPYFHDVVQAGDVIELRGPIGGHFVWRNGDGGPLLLIAGGSGIVPLMAMLRHRAATAPQIDALLVYSARSWDELVFRDELLAAEAADPKFRLLLATTREAKRRPQDQERRLDAASLRQVLADWGKQPRHAYVCGATAFVEAMTSALVDAGIAAASIRAERYGGIG